MVGMDVALELEDDVYFADLSKQIALLIMDDEEEEQAFSRLQYPAVSFQAFSHASLPMAAAAATASPFFYEHACTREIRGTGVFIPRSSLPRRKHRAGRKPKPAVPSVAPPASSTGSTATNAVIHGHKPINSGRKPDGLKKQLLLP